MFGAIIGVALLLIAVFLFAMCKAASKEDEIMEQNKDKIRNGEK